MKKQNLILRSLLDTVGAFIYIALVASLMSNIEKIFDNQPGILGILTFLAVFVLSAAVMGVFIILKPVLLYMDGQKKEAVKLLLYTLGWFFVGTVLALGANFIL